MTDLTALTPEELAEKGECSLAHLATGGTIVCSFCNASDVTDNGHRQGCPALWVKAVFAEFVRRLDAETVRADQAVREKDGALDDFEQENRWRHEVTEQKQAAEAERDQAITRLAVLDGTACAEEQAAGNGPCGVCVTCLRAERDQAVRERDDARARAAEWQHDRDYWCNKAVADGGDLWSDKIAQAVERADRLTAALEQIAGSADTPDTVEARIARDALAASQEQT